MNCVGAILNHPIITIQRLSTGKPIIDDKKKKEDMESEKLNVDQNDEDNDDAKNKTSFSSKGSSLKSSDEKSSKLLKETLGETPGEKSSKELNDKKLMMKVIKIIT